MPRGEGDYRKAVLEARLIGLALAATRQNQLAEQLQALEEEWRWISRLSDASAVDRARVLGVIQDMTTLIEASTREGIELTARDMATLQSRASIQLFSENGVPPPVGIGATFEQVGVRSAQALLARPELAETFRTLREGAASDVNMLLTQATVRGQTSEGLERTLRFYVDGADAIPPELLRDRRLIGARTLTEYFGIDDPTPADVAGIRKFAAGLTSRAMLISRHEMVNAAHEAAAESATQSPVVRAVRWELSARHPKADGCDVLADEDLYGLGPGVYPADAIPALLHPRCLCFFTHVLIEPKDVGKPIPRGQLKGNELEKRMRQKRLNRSARRQTRESIAAGETRRQVADMLAHDVPLTTQDSLKRIASTVVVGGLQAVGTAAISRIAIGAAKQLIAPVGAKLGAGFVPGEHTNAIRLPASAFPLMNAREFDDNLSVIEEWLSRQGWEHYAALDPKTGRPIVVIQGNVHSVDVPHDLDDLLAGSIGIHNHPGYAGPGKRGFSDADWRFMFRNHVSQSPAGQILVTDRYLFRVRGNTGFRVESDKYVNRRAWFTTKEAVSDQLETVFQRRTRFWIERHLDDYLEANPAAARALQELLDDDTGLRGLPDWDVAELGRIPISSDHFDELLRHRAAAAFSRDHGLDYSRILRARPLIDYTFENPMGRQAWVRQTGTRFITDDGFGLDRTPDLSGPPLGLGPWHGDEQLELWEEWQRNLPEKPNPIVLDDNRSLAMELAAAARRANDRLRNLPAIGGMVVAEANQVFVDELIEEFENWLTWAATGQMEIVNRRVVAFEMALPWAARYYGVSELRDLDNLDEMVETIRFINGFFEDQGFPPALGSAYINATDDILWGQIYGETAAEWFSRRVREGADLAATFTEQARRVALVNQVKEIELFVAQAIRQLDQGSTDTDFAIWLQGVVEDEFGVGRNFAHFQLEERIDSLYMFLDDIVERGDMRHSLLRAAPNGSVEFIDDIVSGSAAAERIRENMDKLMASFVREVYEHTQEELAGLPDVIPLFRGWGAGDDLLEDEFNAWWLEDPSGFAEWVRGLGPLGRGVFEPEDFQPFSSFSVSPMVSLRFTDPDGWGTYGKIPMFSVTLVPKEKILSLATTGWGVLREGEAIVLGGSHASFSFRFHNKHLEHIFQEVGHGLQAEHLNPFGVISFFRVLQELVDHGLLDRTEIDFYREMIQTHFTGGWVPEADSELLGSLFDEGSLP